MWTKVSFLFLLVSCTEFLDDNHFDVHPELEYYVNRFYEEGEARGIKLQKVLLANKTYAIKGGESIPGGIPYIRISGHLLDSKDTLRIEYVVFHELGHALLYRDHQDNSIMSTNDYMIPQYKTNPVIREELIDELWQTRKRP